MFQLLILFILTKSTWTYGYDSGGMTNSCGRPYRAGRMHKPPCNLSREGGYCKEAGDNYPWHAVKRFVKENRGLMRRMYGEQPEGSLLKEQLSRISSGNIKERLPRQHHTLDIENELYRDDEEEDFEDLFRGDNYIKQEYEMKFEGRYMRDDDVMRTKFVYSEEPTISIKLAGLKTAPLFRQATTSTTTTSESSTSTVTSTIGTNTNQGASHTTITSTTNDSPPMETSDTDSENATVASLREVDEIIEVTTNVSYETTTNVVDVSSTTQSSSEKYITKSQNPSSSPKPTATAGVLFQDMEENASEKLKVNYKLTGVNACPVKEEVVAPFWANNTRGEVLALLNMYPFEQYIHWEKCSFENKQMYCREGCRCEQQYRLHRLLAYDPQNECKGIFSDWFKFPSCCICKCYGLPSEFRVTSRSPRNREANWFDTGTEND